MKNKIPTFNINQKAIDNTQKIFSYLKNELSKKFKVECQNLVPLFILESHENKMNENDKFLLLKEATLPRFRKKPFAISAFNPQTIWQKISTMKVINPNANETSYNYQISLIPQENIDKIKHYFLQASHILKNFWPSFHYTIVNIISEIIILLESDFYLYDQYLKEEGIFNQDSKHYEHASASLISAPGIIWAGIGKNFCIVDALDILVHETTHQIIWYHNFQKAIFIKGVNDIKIESPLRIDARPIEGVLHAIFVLFNLSILCKKILNNPTELSKSDLKKTYDYYEVNKENLISGVSSFTKYKYLLTPWWTDKFSKIERSLCKI